MRKTPEKKAAASGRASQHETRKEHSNRPKRMPTCMHASNQEAIRSDQQAISKRSAAARRSEKACEGTRRHGKEQSVEGADGDAHLLDDAVRAEEDEAEEQ